MPLLYSLIDISKGGPGFLLPVFKPYRGVNFELVQRIDFHNKVNSFEQVAFDVRDYNRVHQDIEVDVGQEAIWAFQDHKSHQHIGTAGQIRAIGLQLLASGDLSESPMTAAEMAAFCNAEESFPKVLIAAYKRIASLSQTGADTWRDAVILLPKIKEDIAGQVRMSPEIKRQIEDVIAVTRGSKTHIFASSAIMRQVSSLSRWQAISKVFGIESFQIHIKAPQDERKAPEYPTWVFYGVGGVARHVITKPPFKGANRRFSEFPNIEGAIARAPMNFFSPVRGAGLSHLAITVLTSNLREADFANTVADKFAPRGALKHAINVRPLGFGPPKNRKPSPDVLKEHLSQFDYLWIIANHRQRHTGSVAVGLSMSSMASRFVKTTAQALIDCISNERGQTLLRSTLGSKQMGLVGSARFLFEFSSSELIRRALYSMLCEDAYLHSAERIVVLWPYSYDGKDRYQRIRLGSHTYEVELIQRDRSSRNLPIVTLAMNVQLSNRTRADFKDFCISLLDGYGWRVRSDNNDNLLLENEGEVIRVWLAQSIDEIYSLISHDAEFGQNEDLILSNQSVTRVIRERANTRGWAAIHYSELGTWMDREYRIKMYDFT